MKNGLKQAMAELEQTCSKLKYDLAVARRVATSTQIQWEEARAERDAALEELDKWKATAGRYVSLVARLKECITELE